MLLSSISTDLQPAWLREQRLSLSASDSGGTLPDAGHCQVRGNGLSAGGVGPACSRRAQLRGRHSLSGCLGSDSATSAAQHRHLASTWTCWPAPVALTAAACPALVTPGTALLQARHDAGMDSEWVLVKLYGAETQSESESRHWPALVGLPSAARSQLHSRSRVNDTKHNYHSLNAQSACSSATYTPSRHWVVGPGGPGSDQAPKGPCIQHLLLAHTERTLRMPSSHLLNSHTLACIGL